MEKLLGALVAGHICLDIIPDMQALGPAGIKNTFLPGRLLEVGNAALCTGGPVSNTGLALHRLGIPTQLICKIGTDAFGRIVRELIEAYDPGLTAGIVEDPQVVTSYSMIISPPGVDRIVLHNPAANHSFSANDIDFKRLNQAALFHFGYPPVMRMMYSQTGQGLVELFRRVKQTGMTTSLDMCYPDPASEGGRVDWAAILKACLPWVDIFLPSIEELLMMLRPSEYERFSTHANLLEHVTPSLLHTLSEELFDMGVSVLVIKLGTRGLYLRTAGTAGMTKIGRAAPANPILWADKELWSACFQVRVAGTNGAGDATIAGFLSAFLRGLSPEQAVTAAVAVGACNVESTDALSGLRNWEDTLDRVRNGWERHPLHLDDPTWSWDPDNQLWGKGKQPQNKE